MNAIKHKLRKEIFEEIKELYTKDILTYDLSLDKLGQYMSSYRNILVMLNTIKATRHEGRSYIGLDFNKWISETHTQIVKSFL